MSRALMLDRWICNNKCYRLIQIVAMALIHQISHKIHILCFLFFSLKTTLFSKSKRKILLGLIATNVPFKEGIFMILIVLKRSIKNFENLGFKPPSSLFFLLNTSSNVIIYLECSSPVAGSSYAVCR